MITNDKSIHFLIENQITANQFLLCYLIHLKDHTTIKKYILNCKGWKHAEIDDLCEKNYLTNFNPQRMKGGKLVQSYDTDYIMVTPKFDSLMIDEIDAAKEFWDNYPAFFDVIQGKKNISAKNVNYDKFCEYYNSIIKGNNVKHKEILDIVQKWKQENRGFATMTLEKFLQSKHYEDLKKKYDKPKPKIRAY
jgi:hypothetical protein